MIVDSCTSDKKKLLKRLRQVFSLACMFLLFSMLIFSCQESVLKEVPPNINADLAVTERSQPDSIPIIVPSECVPGNIVIESGVMRFITFQDFIQTLHFLNCANEDDKEAWRNSFPLMTSEKHYLEFKNAFCGDNELTDEQIEALITAYEGKVKVVREEGSAIHFDYFTDGYPEFENLDGIFRIENSIEKITPTHRITITDGDWDKLEAALNSLEGNPENGIVIIPRWATTSCCYGFDPKKGAIKEKKQVKERCEKKLEHFSKWSDSAFGKIVWDMKIGGLYLLLSTRPTKPHLKGGHWEVGHATSLQKIFITTLPGVFGITVRIEL
jgi:hypothetical protein